MLFLTVAEHNRGKNYSLWAGVLRIHPHKLIDICFNIYNYNYRGLPCHRCYLLFKENRHKKKITIFVSSGGCLASGIGGAGIYTHGKIGLGRRRERSDVIHISNK